MFNSRTDLACEAIPKKVKDGDFGGLTVKTKISDGIEIIEVNVLNQLGASAIGRDIGKYVTVICGRAWLYEKEFTDNIISAVSSELRKMIDGFVQKPCKILICGLGNKHITSDALGYMTTEMLCATGHTDEYLDYKSFVIAPGVISQSGIDAFDAVLSACNSIRADLVLVIDSLASKGLDRLCKTIQITDTGICPGSGTGICRKRISMESLKIPVISIGVPTVIDSSTLIYEALKEAKIEDVPYELNEVLNNRRDFFVSPKDSDVIVSTFAKIISKSIALAINNVSRSES